MTQEEKLQKRLNEICFPEYTIEFLDPMYEWEGGYIKVPPSGKDWEQLEKITLELVLKALVGNLKYIGVIPDPRSQHFLIYCQSVKYKLSNFYKWELLKPFSQQPTETQQALFKIFEITDN